MQRGKSEIENFYKASRSAFPDFKVELTSRSADGDRATAEWHSTGTHQGDLLGLPATHKAISLRGVSIFEFAGSKIKRVTDYYNWAELVRPLGV